MTADAAVFALTRQTTRLSANPSFSSAFGDDRPITIACPTRFAGMWPATWRFNAWGGLNFEKVAAMNIQPFATARSLALPIAMLFATATLAGCAGQVSLLPNSDKTLRRTPAQFASEAAKRTYQIDLPDGGVAEGRAEVAYDGNFFQVLNLSEEDWTDIELWVNQKYVVHVPRIEAGKKRVKSITFMMLYDDQGNPFPSDNRRQMIKTLELVKDGTKYSIPLTLAD
jgi:hypothetical protein